eukprot:Em0458g2a
MVGMQFRSSNICFEIVSWLRRYYRELRGTTMNTQPRQGYMGHLLKIVNCLVMSGDTDEQLRDVLKTNLSKEMFSRWSDFLSGPVADQNKKNDTNLGGNCPLGTNVDDSDDEFDPVNVQPDNELEKAFSQYQDAKYVNTFVEDFGVWRTRLWPSKNLLPPPSPGSWI